MKKIFLIAIFSLSLIFFPVRMAEASLFSDVSKNFWAYDEISVMVKNKYMNGYSDGRFGQGQPITRIDAAKALALAIGAKPSPQFKPKFKDIAPNHESYDHVRALTEMGIFVNVEKFNPNNSLTRAQMSKILTLGFDLIIDDNHLIGFKDVRDEHFRGYITTLAEVGITTTVDGGKFKPNGHVTRAHMAAFLHRSMKFSENREKGKIYYDAAKKLYIGDGALKPSTSISVVPTKAIETIRFVNDKRADGKLSALVHDVELSRIAQAKAEDMIKNNYFAHESPTYGGVGDMLTKFNYYWTAYGENIAYGYTAPKQVVQGWIDSPGHLKNIMSRGYTNIGVGYAEKPDGTPYWVHIFSKTNFD